MAQQPQTRRPVFAGRVFDVGIEEHLLPNGRRAEFEVVHHVGGAAVLPRLDDGRLLLIRQFRPAVGAMVYEIPAGRIDPGEAPRDCARRELEEETGYRAGRIESLGGMLSAVGYCDEYVALFFADSLQKTRQALEPDEIVELAPMTLDAALDKLLAGEIADSKTQIALLRLALREQGGGR
ncbi:MAG: NUDIX hydrolase [Desulfuromonadales bacterium]|nr:NUDIX hydrolase [Desulfuromonadales bacterium]